MARYRVIRRRITKAEWDNLPRGRKYNISEKAVVFIPQRKVTLLGWMCLDADQPLEVYFSQEEAEEQIFLEKAGVEVVISEFISKDDPLYRVKVPNES
jgi:hypothetical protein